MSFEAYGMGLISSSLHFSSRLVISWCGGPFNGGNCPSCSIVGPGNEFVYDPNPFPHYNTPDFYGQPPHPQYETYSCELCGNDSHYGFDCPPRFPLAANIDQSPPREKSLQEMEDLKQHYLDEMLSLSNDLQIKDYRNEKIDIRFRRECEDMIDELKEQVANLSTYPSQCFKSFCYDDDDDDDYQESSIPLREIISKLPPSIAIIPVLPTLEPEDSLIMGDEHLSTIPEKESDEFIKSSVEDLVPIPSESEDTSGSDSDCDLPLCDDFSPIINVYEEKFVTFSNPLFDSNADFTYSDDESLSDEDVPEENVKIYSNPLFKFDDEYISSDVNPLFDEVLENIESKESYVSNLDEPVLLVTPLSDANEDECFDPGGENNEIDAFLDIDISTDIENGYHDSEGDITYLESLLIDLPPEVFLDHDPRSLKDEPDNLKSRVKVFDPGIHEKIFSPTYVKLPFEDRHYLSLTYVIRIFLPYFTYPVESPFLLSSGSEDTIFDPGIPVFSLEPVVSHRSGTFMCFNVYLNILNESPMEICSSTCFNPNISMIWGESS
ncbi:hypothetical protein Tco_0060406 [Tanacetum coccineum]